MSHTNDIDILVQRIYWPSIFYIPKNLFSNLTPKQEKELLDYRVINAVGILKGNGDTTYSDKCVPAFEFLGKSTKLDNNVYQLQKLRDSLSKETFAYLLDEYEKNILACKYVYNWLLENIDGAIDKVTEDEKGLFELQLALIESHIDKVYGMFDLKKAENRSVVGNTDDLNSSVFSHKGGKQIIKVPKNQKPKGSIKTYLPSELEIDKYLLETVFNIDSSKLEI